MHLQTPGLLMIRLKWGAWSIFPNFLGLFWPLLRSILSVSKKTTVFFSKRFFMLVLQQKQCVFIACSSVVVKAKCAAFFLSFLHNTLSLSLLILCIAKKSFRSFCVLICLRPKPIKKVECYYSSYFILNAFSSVISTCETCKFVKFAKNRDTAAVAV